MIPPGCLKKPCSQTFFVVYKCNFVCKLIQASSLHVFPCKLTRWQNDH
uniref:Uncharacterized protein n=1 Tax=Rhizophora mucronata TaxID=61149 RepID=A0A2P2NUS6_RHIMU